MYVYPVGRVGVRLTAEQFQALKTVRLLDPEVQRRAMGLMRFAQSENRILHFSGGWRDGQFASNEFYRRYTRTTQTRRNKVTDKFYQGVWWSLNAGEIGVATPWNGWHTFGQPGSPSADVAPVAIDWWGDLAWMQANCARVGFRHFKHIPGEGHHTQPVEYPGSRDGYRGQQLTIWPLDDTEDNMIRFLQADNDNVTVFAQSGVHCTWVQDGHVWLGLTPITVNPGATVIPRVGFRGLKLSGPIPPGWSPTDFASWVQ